MLYVKFECDTCSREFDSPHAVNQHMNALDHRAPTYDCETCDRVFINQHAANQHMNDTGHRGPKHECETCTAKFFTEESANVHMNRLDHWAVRYDCEACHQKFRTVAGAKQHMDEFKHWRKNYCSGCQRGFQSESHLRAHLNSRTHRGTQVLCPFCRTAFATASGVSHHLESSSCPKTINVNRETIYKAIKLRDPHGQITKKLLTYPDFNMKQAATSASWNGDFYECYLCHREFTSLNALNQHLASPAHKQKIYHCPSRQCEKDFVSLAALFNHLESESCGAMRFEKVQSGVQNFFTGGQRLITF